MLSQPLNRTCGVVDRLVPRCEDRDERIAGLVTGAGSRRRAGGRAGVVVIRPQQLKLGREQLVDEGLDDLHQRQVDVGGFGLG